LYDLPIGYWRAARRLLKDERERWPQWAATMPGFHDSDEKLARKDEELRLADRIYVASQFTKQTLTDYPGTLAPVEVIPYGFPAVGPPRDYSDRATRKLKLLFVGGLSQRKGIADVFAVAEMLKDDVELTIVGQGAVNECVALSNALKRHHWVPSLPHAQILDLMREHDILLFPSLFEGFGLVITEAMSQGTPVITTERTAGPDLIQHEKNGWLIAAGNTSALQSQIESILNDRDSIQSVGEQARQSAMVRPWSVYGKELANSVIKGLKTKL
jgi:glycosyltransferase involved in cell wall biosynthesis